MGEHLQMERVSSRPRWVVAAIGTFLVMTFFGHGFSQIYTSGTETMSVNSDGSISMSGSFTMSFRDPAQHTPRPRKQNSQAVKAVKAVEVSTVLKEALSSPKKVPPLADNRLGVQPLDQLVILAPRVSSTTAHDAAASEAPKASTTIASTASNTTHAQVGGNVGRDAAKVPWGGVLGISGIAMLVAAVVAIRRRTRSVALSDQYKALQGAQSKEPTGHN